MAGFLIVSSVANFKHILYTLGISVSCSVVVAQETPPTTRVVTKDTLVPIKERPFFERMAERYASDSIEPNKKGIVGKPGSTIGIGYRIRKTKGDKKPFGSQHSLMANYGINRGAFFIEYKSIFNQVVAQWALNLNARADIINVINFYGTGNGTVKNAEDEAYELKSSEWLGALGLSREFSRHHLLELRSFFQSVLIDPDNHKFITDLLAGATTEDFKRNNYIGFSAGYRFLKTDYLINPSTGWEFGALASYTINFDSEEYGFSRYTSYLTHYLPLSKKLTLANRVGGAHIIGNPQFYQLNILGGRETLRGFRRQRFYGTSSIYFNNELRFLVPTNKKFFQRIGLIAFTDLGRVWTKNDSSGRLHIGYGGGLIIIPFNKIVLNGSYGFSEEDNVMHLRIGYLF